MAYIESFNEKGTKHLSKVVRGYFDGRDVKLIDPIDTKPNQKVIVTVLNELVESKTENHKPLVNAFAGGLVYISDDFDSPIDDFKEYI